MGGCPDTGAPVDVDADVALHAEAALTGMEPHVTLASPGDDLVEVTLVC